LGDRAERWTGRALLELAAAIQRTIASEDIHDRHQNRRNKLIRRAHKLGMPYPLMAQRTKLSEGRIRQLVKPDEPAGE
jgi:hypothetical protein